MYLYIIAYNRAPFIAANMASEYARTKSMAQRRSGEMDIRRLYPTLSIDWAGCEARAKEVFGQTLVYREHEYTAYIAFLY